MPSTLKIIILSKQCSYICYLLFLQLKKAFPKKNIPPAPPKGLLRMKNRALLEEVGNVLWTLQFTFL